jgi:uncharacterized membrane protein YphA (DoxX/SURF4 family)
VSDLLLGGRWLLAVVLVVAGLSKLSEPGRHRVAQAIRDYGALRERVVEPATALLPWLELSLGALLCVGVGLLITGCVVAIMMGAFAAVVGWHVARGHKFDCGCGSRATPIGWLLVGRNLMLGTVSLGVAVGPSGALAAWPGWGAAAVSGSAASVIPVPLVTVLCLLALRLVMGSRHARVWRTSLDPEPLEA